VTPRLLLRADELVPEGVVRQREGPVEVVDRRDLSRVGGG